MPLVCSRATDDGAQFRKISTEDFRNQLRTDSRSGAGQVAAVLRLISGGATNTMRSRVLMHPESYSPSHK
jgi:hypothetical protein